MTATITYTGTLTGPRWPVIGTTNPHHQNMVRTVAGLRGSRRADH